MTSPRSYSHVSFTLFLLLVALLVESEAVKVGKSDRRKEDTRDRSDSSEDYDDSPSYDDDADYEDKEKRPPPSGKVYYVEEKSQNKVKEMYPKNFKSKEFDSAEFGGIDFDTPTRRKSSSFDAWVDDEDDDFSDFKDFPEEPRESPSSGYRSRAVRPEFPGTPFNHEYSITHPKTISKKSFDFDDDFFHSKEETEGAFSSNVQTPELPDYKKKVNENINKADYGPLLMIPHRRVYKPDKQSKDHKSDDREHQRRHSIATDYTNKVPKKVKFDPEQLINNNTNCYKTRKAMKGSSGKEKMMVCYECYDDDNEKTFERCSFESEPEEKKFTYEAVKTTKHHHKGDGNRRHRAKREIFPDDSSEAGFGFGDGDFNLGPDSAEFYGPEFADVDEDPDRSGSKGGTYSEAQPGETCLTTKKNNMICVRCMNPSTNGLSEQCSYESEPKENSYQYSTKKSYGTPSEPKIQYPDRFRRSTPDVQTRRRRIKKTEKNVTDNQTVLPAEDVLKTDGFPSPIIAPVETVSSQNRVPAKRVQSATDIYNNHFLRMFPEFKSDDNVEFDVAKTINSMTADTADKDSDESASVFVFEDSNNDYNIDPNDYRRLLGEFVAKDWSNCTKSIKGNLTCYYCKDKDSSHEECLHISDAERLPENGLGPSDDNSETKRYFLNKISPKKFFPHEKADILTKSRARRPRSVRDRPDFDDFFKSDRDDNRRQYDTEYFYEHPETDNNFNYDEYDPEFESNSPKFTPDHDVPFF